MKKILIAILILFPFFVLAAIEDPTTWTENDPSGYFTETATSVTATALPRNVSNSVYYDYGLNFFSGNFTHYFETTCLGGDAAGILLADVVSQSTSTVPGDTGVNALYVKLRGNGDVQFGESDNGTNTDAVAYDDSACGNRRFIKTVKDEAVGDYGTYYVYVYEDEARTSLLGSESIALNSSLKDYQYISASSYHYNDTVNITANFGNYNLDLTTPSSLFIDQSVIVE